MLAALGTTTNPDGPPELLSYRPDIQCLYLHRDEATEILVQAKCEPVPGDTFAGEERPFGWLAIGDGAVFMALDMARQQPGRLALLNMNSSEILVQGTTYGYWWVKRWTVSFLMRGEPHVVLEAG
jgi:hypothetical protein